MHLARFAPIAIRRESGNLLHHTTRHDLTAVQDLIKLVNDKRGSIPDAVVLKEIQRILKIDFLLANLAIKDVEKSGVNISRLEGANAAINQGIFAMTRMQFASAVSYFRNSWLLASNQAKFHLN